MTWQAPRLFVSVLIHSPVWVAAALVASALGSSRLRGLAFGLAIWLGVGLLHVRLREWAELMTPFGGHEAVLLGGSASEVSIRALVTGAWTLVLLLLAAAALARRSAARGVFTSIRTIPEG